MGESFMICSQNLTKVSFSTGDILFYFYLFILSLFPFVIVFSPRLLHYIPFCLFIESKLIFKKISFVPCLAHLIITHDKKVYILKK